MHAAGGLPPRQFVMLLKGSFVPGDEQAVEQVLSRKLVNNIKEWHWFLEDVVELFESNPTIKATRALEYVYENTPCSACRGRAVKLLVQLGTVSQATRTEGMLDANQSVRSALSAE
jgi:hypothetical protein